MFSFDCFAPSSKLDNSRNEASGGTGRHVYLEFCQYAGAMSRYVDHRICPAGPPISEQAEICRSFSVSFT